MIFWEISETNSQLGRGFIIRGYKVLRRNFALQKNWRRINFFSLDVNDLVWAMIFA